MERVAVLDPEVADPAERGVELGRRHREREVVAALGAERRELDREVAGVTRRTVNGPAVPSVGEAEHRRVPGDAGVDVVHRQDHVVELHGAQGTELERR